MMSWFMPFSTNDLRSQLQARKKKLAGEVRQAGDDYILSVGEAQYVEHLVEEYSISPLVLGTEEVSASEGEEMISAELFPRTQYHVRAGARYPKQVLTFHVPFEGDSSLFRSRASRSTYGGYPEIRIVGDEVQFKHIAFSSDPVALKRAMDDGLTCLQRGVGFIRADVDSYNDQLPAYAESVLQARKVELLKRRDLTASLGVPIRTKSPATPTVSISPPNAITPRRAKPPIASPGDYVPEPALDEGAYRDILANIWSFGGSMERAPDTFAKFSEEELRDQFITYLTPRVEGTTTGETFNKAGKTDILIRHKDRNVFVAELGLWSGTRAFTAKIDQMLGYLTWRDSKAALVMIVPNRNMSKPTRDAQAAIAAHATHVKLVDEPGDAWSDHILHLPDDPGREVRVALMLFHIPK
jgi:hypothetical protein